MKNINPTLTPSWKELKEHFSFMKDVKIKDLFIDDPKRFRSFSLFFRDQMLIDFSKNRITQETLKKLLNLAKDCFLKEAIFSMFHGEKINVTENRAVLHVALRSQEKKLYLDGKNIMDDIRMNLKKIEEFSKKVINGDWVGYSGKCITDVVNIGIGGSNLGPYMVTEALAFYKNHLKIHFVSNVDGTHIVETLKTLNPETTLFLIASKTFLTQETMTNAHSAREWFLKNAKSETYMFFHFFALSSNIKEVVKFGIDINNVFQLWDWVCGRYSLWSSIGLSIALSIGYSNFKKLLIGAYDMDQHFSLSPLEKNIPVILALISIWYNNFFNMETEAIIPYDQYMHKFPAYFQQMSMESNGKYIDRNGFPVKYQTSPIIWGESGTNGQHSFYQLLHQGTKIVPCDFIAPAISHNSLSDHHEKLLSNFFAQTEALAFGNLQEDFEKECLNNLKTKFNFSFKLFEGNRPTNSILIKKITPYNLGALISLYEHKIFTQGVILNIFSFDQWGVELGKKLSNEIFVKLKDQECCFKHDISTNGLLNQYKYWKYSGEEID